MPRDKRVALSHFKLLEPRVRERTIGKNHRRHSYVLTRVLPRTASPSMSGRAGCLRKLSAVLWFEPLERKRLNEAN